MKKLLVSLLLAAALLLNTAPARALQPVDSPDFYPALQALTQRGKDAPYVCNYRQQHADRLAQTTQASWLDWIEKLSGAETVTVGGVQRTINNRHSYSLFNRTDTSSAISYGFDYLEETVRSWEPKVQVEVDPYQAWYSYSGLTWKNLIVTIPGTRAPDEVVLLTAHFDSVNRAESNFPQANSTAPGADDNASGSATLLEAARILKDAPLERTVRLVWFTGEEQGLLGSGAYTSDHNLSNVVGVINLDMYAYDSDNDRCFELHVSNPGYNTDINGDAVSASERIGACFVNTIDAYDINLRYYYASGNATGRSDHSSFWLAGIGAIEVGENFFNNSAPGDCLGMDINDSYHQATDTIETINPVTGFDIHRAALATLFAMGTLPERSLLAFSAYMPIFPVEILE